MVAARDVVDHPALAVETHKNKRITPVDIGLPDALQNQSERRRTGATRNDRIYKLERSSRARTRKRTYGVLAFEWTCRKCLGADACLLDPPHGHRPYTRGPRVGAGIPDERDRNRVSVSKSICHSEFPESTRACACAQGGVGSESASCGRSARGPQFWGIREYQ
jgi:hypothetical protein